MNSDHTLSQIGSLSFLALAALTTLCLAFGADASIFTP
jgi:hypothetical protein